MSEEENKLDFLSLLKQIENGMKSNFKKYLEIIGENLVAVEDVKMSIDNIVDTQEYVDLDIDILLTLRMRK